MTLFEKLKAQKCMEIKLSINYQNALLDKWENMSIQEMAKEYIQKLDNGEYRFTFRLDPHERITVNDYDKLLEIIKLYYSQEASNND